MFLLNMIDVWAASTFFKRVRVQYLNDYFKH